MVKPSVDRSVSLRINRYRRIALRVWIPTMHSILCNVDIIKPNVVSLWVWIWTRRCVHRNVGRISSCLKIAFSVSTQAPIPLLQLNAREKLPFLALRPWVLIWTRQCVGHNVGRISSFQKIALLASPQASVLHHHLAIRIKSLALRPWVLT